MIARKPSVSRNTGPCRPVGTSSVAFRPPASGLPSARVTGCRPGRERLRTVLAGQRPVEAGRQAHLPAPGLTGRPAAGGEVGRGRGEGIGEAAVEIDAAVTVAIDRVTQPGAGHELRLTIAPAQEPVGCGLAGSMPRSTSVSAASSSLR